MKNIISIIIIALLFASCDKVIEVDYKSNQSNIIIQGNITNQPGPYFVKITRSISLTDTGSYPTIDDAVVVISDDAGNAETLAPQGKGLYSATALRGVEGRTYTLKVQAAGQQYTAQSTMPKQVQFDSIKIDPVVFAGDTEYNVIPVYTDPVARGNKYRFVLSVGKMLINQQFVQNDDIKNGVANTFRLDINDDDLKPIPRDTVTLVMQCIDDKVALYYTTLALISDSGPGGGTTPANPPANITNGALGIFSAHTVQTRSTVVQMK